MPIRKTKEQFISGAIKVHGDKYDYSKVNYINNRTKVLIGCAIHGDFEQTPHEHLTGCGCTSCYTDKRGLIRRKTDADFVTEANKIHNNYYVYDKVKYTTAFEPVIITCPIHGDFKQAPHNHLKGQGCPKCGIIKMGNSKRYTQNDCIKMLTDMYGDKYDFSKVVYRGNKTKVTVVCPKHGEFEIKPNDLFMGHGCKQCGVKLNKSELQVLNLLKENFSGVEYQKTFDFLKSRTSSQTIDFYLNEYNVGIEYQGAQHFKPISVFGGVKRFETTKEQDLRKYKKCKEHGIKLYYISFEKNIPETYIDKIYTNIEELITEIKNSKAND